MFLKLIKVKERNHVGLVMACTEMTKEEAKEFLFKSEIYTATDEVAIYNSNLTLNIYINADSENWYIKGFIFNVEQEEN